MADIFICYATKHPVYAYLLEDALRDRFTWFRDQRNLPPAEEWQKFIDSEIQKATVLVAIVTEEAVASLEVKREIKVAKAFNKPCVSLIMERLQSKGASLSELGLDERQAIDFVPENGLEAGLESLLDALDRLTDTWAPIEKNIQRLGHFSWIVRQQAVRELVATEDSRVLNALIESLEVEDSNDVKEEILLNMDHFDDQRTMNIILSKFALSIGSRRIDMLNRMLARFGTTEGYLIAGLPQINDENLRLGWASQFTLLNSTSCKDIGFQELIKIAETSGDGDTVGRAVGAIVGSGHPQTERTLIDMYERAATLGMRELIRDQFQFKFGRELHT